MEYYMLETEVFNHKEQLSHVVSPSCLNKLTN